jgi:hypothetical protein
MILVFLSFSVLFGQRAQTAVDSAEKKAVIDALCENLEREYIFPEITEKYIRMLRDNLRSGKYDGIGQPLTGSKKSRYSRETSGISNSTSSAMTRTPMMPPSGP